MQKKLVSRAIGTFIQDKGGLGKSSVTNTLAPWCDHHDVPWSGVDLDDVHRAFAARYETVTPLTVIEDASSGADEVVKMLKGVLSRSHPVVLVDSRAQLSPYLLDTIQRINFFEYADEQGVRLTNLILPADDDDALKSLQVGLQRVGKRMDHVIVRIPSVFRTRRFDGSLLEKTLLDLGAGSISLPSILESTKRSIQRAEKLAGKPLPLPDVLERLTDFAKADLEHYLSNSFREFDRVASLLLPEQEAAKVVPQKEAGSTSTAFGNLSLTGE